MSRKPRHLPGQRGAAVAKSRAVSPGVRVLRADEGQFSVNIEARSLPLPSRAMAPTWTAARRRDDDVELIFAHAHPTKQKLVAALFVTMPADKVRDSLPLDFVESLRGRFSTTPARPLPDPADYEWPEEHLYHERATLTTIAYLENDAELRFYRVSPEDFQRIKAGADADLVYPVVQVHLSARVLFDVVEHLLQECAVERGED